MRHLGPRQAAHEWSASALVHAAPAPTLLPGLRRLTTGLRSLTLGLALGLIAGCSDRLGQPPVLVVPVSTPVTPRPMAQPPDAPGAGTSYVQELATLSRTIDEAMGQLRAQPDNLVLAGETVLLVLERARLSGNMDDYRAAQQLLDASLPRARNAAALCQAQARLHFALHRLQDAAEAAGRCQATMDAAETAALAADIALYSGQYQAAEAAYRDLVNQTGLSSHYIRLALFRLGTGAPGEAAALLEAAEKRYHGGSAATRAWLRLQRGLAALERGRLDEALALYQLAADAMPGWWLVDEHIAEIRRLTGDLDGARVLLESLVARHGFPEHMDELARVLRDGARPEAAAPWIARADALYRARLAAFPQAGAGHAVDHWLEFGTPAEALELARNNARWRPYGEAQIALAVALLHAGQADAAATLLRQVQDSGWRSARLHAVAAQVHAAAGQPAAAQSHRARALSMNPHAMRLYLIPTPAQAQPRRSSRG